MSQEFPVFLDSVCESLDAVSRLTRSSLMVFDFVKSEIVYHSRKLLFIDGDEGGLSQIAPLIFPGNENEPRLCDGFEHYLFWTGTGHNAKIYSIEIWR